MAGRSGCLALVWPLLETHHNKRGAAMTTATIATTSVTVALRRWAIICHLDFVLVVHKKLIRRLSGSADLRDSRDQILSPENVLAACVFSVKLDPTPKET